MKILIGFAAISHCRHRPIKFLLRRLGLKNEIQIFRLILSGRVDRRATAACEYSPYAGAAQGLCDCASDILEGRSGRQFQSFLPVRRGRRRSAVTRLRSLCSGSASRRRNRSSSLYAK
jgi:hypothetical protein